MYFNSTYFAFRARLQPIVPLEKKCNHLGQVTETKNETKRKASKGSANYDALITSPLSFFSPPASPSGKHYRFTDFAKTLTLFLCLCLYSTNLFAQTPTYALTGGTSANSWPFSAANTGSNKVQWLYYPSNFPTAPAGSVTKIYFRTSNAGTYSITDLTIKMGTTSLSTFTSGTYQTGLTTVFSATSSVTIPSNGWMGITLTTPFYYDGTSNFIVEASHNGASSTGITVLQNNSTPNGRIYGNIASSSGTATTGLTDFGMDIMTGPPCPKVLALAVSGKSSTTLSFSWSAPSSSVGYSYALTTSTTPPTAGFTNTTATSASFTGLTPSTQYYFHIRNNCSATNYSGWDRQDVMTNPPCGKPATKVSDVTTKSAIITWPKIPYVTKYEYALKQDTSKPTTGTTQTPDTFFKPDNLPEGTKYYVFVRMYCEGNEVSPWALDSFTTRTVCRPPVLNVTNIDASRAVIYWNHVPTALSYEYEVSQSPTPLGKGTEILTNSFLAFPLKDGNVYYFHVKSKCEDQGFVSESDWGTTSFKTWPTSVANSSSNGFMITAFPNPTTDLLTLSIAGTIAGDAELTLMDINGRIASRVKVVGNTSSIDLSKVPAGLYLLRYADARYSEVIKVTKK
ncbi:MAG: T9SS type A sorting domain-containing protein [Sphingobacteriales bacterium]|nr:MAG: T9SS type A sorting domain-containing protein [Sphingobacteriales bacterium]